MAETDVERQAREAMEALKRKIEEEEATGTGNTQ